MQNHRRSRGQRDERRRGKVIFDNGEIDAATPKKLGDAPGLPDVATDRRVRDRRNFDAVERLVHRRANDQGRARISAVKNQVTNAEFDRSGEPRPEMCVSQQDVGDFRLARHHHIRNSRRAARLGVLTRKGPAGQLTETIDCRPRRILLERAPGQGPIDRTLMPRLERRARPNQWFHPPTSQIRLPTLALAAKRGWSTYRTRRRRTGSR